MQFKSAVSEVVFQSCTILRQYKHAQIFYQIKWAFVEINCCKYAYKVNVLVKLNHYAFTAFGEKGPVQLTPLLMPILKIAHVIW